MKNKNKKKKLSVKQKISRLLYAISIILIITIIPTSAEFFHDLLRESQRAKGYTSEEIANDFINTNYNNMIEKIAANRAINSEIKEEDEKYYAFADCYVSAFNYHMYSTTNQKDKAAIELKRFKDSAAKIESRIFKDRIQLIKEEYSIPE